MKRNSRIISVLLILCMLAVVCTGCSQKNTDPPATSPTASNAPQTGSPSAAPTETPFEELDPVVIKFATGTAEGEMGEEAAQRFVELVEERSNGQITFDYYNNGQLGSLVEIAESMNLGTLDAGKLDPTLMDTYVPEFKLLTLPFLIKDYEHITNVVQLDEIKVLLDELAEEHNITALGWTWSGFRAICSKTAIRNVADCEGILLRSPEAKIYMDTFKLLGMSPTPIAFSELYTAVQAGVVDGAEPAASVIYQQGLHKLAPYVCRSNHMFSLNIICFSTELFNSLPAAYQEILTETATDVCLEEQAAMEASEDECFDLMAADGATITEWEDFSELVDLFTPYWNETIEAIGGNAAQIVEAIKGLV